MDKFITKQSILNLPMAVQKYLKEKGEQIDVVIVDEVFSGSQADQIGLEAGDIIFEYDGIRISNQHDLVYAVKNTKQKDSIVISIIRDSEIKKFNINRGRIGVKVLQRNVPKESIPADFL